VENPWLRGWGFFFVLYQEIFRQKYRIKERAILKNTQAKEYISNLLRIIDSTRSKRKRKESPPKK
jgi:intergrase/recombinase